MREIKKSTVHVHGIQEDQKKMIEDTNRSYFRSMNQEGSELLGFIWCVSPKLLCMVGFALETKPTKN